MKKYVIIAICIGVCTAVSVACTFNNTEEAISKGVIRLHVLAHDDTSKEQELKIKVRDRILDACKELYGNENKKEKIRSITVANLDHFRRVAQDEVIRNGYNHRVEVTFGKSKFPAKVYDEICLPGGSYEALVVKIGSAGGRNWWCVMFPPLCFVNESCEGMTPETRSMMIDNIGKEAYEMISLEKPQIKFKIYEWWKKVNKE